MNKLDEILRKAKPAVPELTDSFTERVMSEIRELDANPAKTAVTAGHRNPVKFAGGIILLIFGLVIVNQTIFEIQSNGSLELLYAGQQFVTDAFKYIPWDLIVTALVLTFLSSWLVWRSNMIKKGIAVVLAGSVLVSGFGGAAMAMSDVNSLIKNQIVHDKREWPWLSYFYKDRARYCIDHPNFRMGRVLKTDGSRIVIVNPNGEKIELTVPETMTVKPGQVISVTGNEADKTFMVDRGRHCDMNRVGRYFDHGSMMMHHMNGGMMRHMGGGMMRNMGRGMMSR